MTIKHFRYYQDPGHGWIAVKRQLLVDLGIAEDISGYSYQRGQTVYLEEDCDADRFLNALEAQGIEYKLQHVYQDPTPIRDYEGYAMGEELDHEL